MSLGSSLRFLSYPVRSSLEILQFYISSFLFLFEGFVLETIHENLDDAASAITDYDKGIAVSSLGTDGSCFFCLRIS
ncbi:hypothetical protein OWV82_012759 [Melia azedarach]|uniref:Uncharacterized protein n=1 Tax=Melia azedarach TaxID=155640 RepID=A0ACC1XTJ7_MELAZ|nr:hypothetical protein OWV82_012759 [Melia azedarach]